MSKIQEFIDKFSNKPPQSQLYEAEVVSVQGNTCTVKVIESDMEVPDVKLVADAVSFGLLLTPVVGSRVLVGLIENDVSSLYVAQYSEVKVLEFKVDDTEVIADNGGVILKTKGASIFAGKDEVQMIVGQTEVTLKGGKVIIKNAGVNLKDLFADLITLLNSFSVLTSTGPSAGLNPATTALLTQLNLKVNQLLQ